MTPTPDTSDLTVPHRPEPTDYFQSKVKDIHNGRLTLEVTTEVWNQLMDRLGHLEGVARTAKEYVQLRKNGAPNLAVYAEAESRLFNDLVAGVRFLDTLPPNP